MNESRQFPIVGIGASAGGLEAFTQLLAALPSDTGLGFVLVQHLDPDHPSALAQILSRTTSLPVSEIADDEKVLPNHVYVIPRDTTLTLVGGVLKTQPRERTRAPHRPIDAFFESLAQDQRERAVGVVLSGTATDGTLGLEAIKAEGGITFAQDASAKQDSMPRSAIAAGCVDLVLSPADIAKELARIARHPYVAGESLLVRAEGEAEGDESRTQSTAHEDDETPLPSGGKGTPRTGAQQARAETDADPATTATGEQDGYKKILLLLRNHCGVDFSLYKSTTIQRRIARRLVLSKQNTLEGYAGFLRGNGKELDALYSDVLISVTSFFRNPETFSVLEDRVFPELLKQRGEDPLRVWILGCSTGQEAYSIAMSFVEVAEKAPRLRRLQVFATDLNDALLDKARHGLYAKSMAGDISPQRLRRFFVEEDGGYRVTKMLREMVVFARQNLISDPPFSRMDLISCRNLLIYLEPGLQRHAIPTFHYALKPGGFLLLGASESIGGFTDLFEPVDKRHKIYSKKLAPLAALHLPLRKEPRDEPQGPRPHLPLRQRGAAEQPDEQRGELDAQREADRITVNQFAPPAVLVNADLQILQFRGPTGAFLEPPTGKASFDVLKMAREGLMLPLRSAIQQAKDENKTARKENVRVERNGETRTVNLEVIPLRNLRERCFLVVFEDPDKDRAAREVRAPTPAPAGSSPGEAAARIAELEAELAETREYLHSIQEQHETGSEELQAANEEVQSANEELQSINEELETSKEELESANEELTTVNDEMSNRNIELNRLNNDLVNLQTSTRLPVVLLGRDLTIRRFSPQAEKQFELLAADVGRPISHVRHNLELADAPGGPLDMEGLVAKVIEGVREEERDVRDRAGRAHSLRVRPYLTLDNRVDGAVLVLLDIDALKRSEQAAAAARDAADGIVDTVREPLLVLDAELRVERANRAFYRTFGVAAAETVGKLIYDLGNGQWNIPRLRELLLEIASRNTTVEDFEVEAEFQSLGLRTMMLNARRMNEPQQQSERILLAIEDVTEKRRAQEALQDLNAELRENEKRLREASTELSEADRRKNEFLAMLGHELRNPLSALTHGLDLLGKVPDDPARSEELRGMMVRQARRIRILLDQLLDIARVISGKVALHKESIDVVELARAAIETVRPLFDAQRVDLALSLPSNGRALVLGDAVRLTQVVENLLTNAAKYTDEGGQVALVIETDDSGVRIIVRDTGIGISAELLPHVFEVFTQAPRALDRSKGGLGLGLPLVKRLVEMHGGEVKAGSAGLGKGSEFVVTLPRLLERRTVERSAEVPVQTEPRPRRILIVDDEVDVANAFAGVLEKEGHQTLAVNDGPAALRSLLTFAPEVVLLDLGLPSMDGYQVARKLRAQSEGKELLLIAVTGYLSDSSRLKEAGIDRHLIKPPDLHELSSILAAWDSDS